MDRSKHHWNDWYRDLFPRLIVCRRDITRAIIAISHSALPTVDIGHLNRQVSLVGVIHDTTRLTQCIGHTEWQRGIAIIDGAGGIPPSRPTGSKNDGRCSQWTAVIVGFPTAAVQGWMRRRYSIYGGNHVAGAVIGRVAGDRRGALIGTVTIDFDGGRQSLRWRRNGCVDALIIGNISTAPHVATGVVGFAVSHFIDVVICRPTQHLIVEGIGPFLREVREAGIGGGRTLDRFLGEIMVVTASLEASCSGVVIIGVIMLHPWRTGTIRSLIQRGHTFEHNDHTRRVGQIQRPVAGIGGAVRSGKTVDGPAQ